MANKVQFPPRTVVIYSVGLLGGSLGLGLKKSGFTGRIIGISSLATIEKALEIGCIDEGYPYEQLAEVIAYADLLFLCSPITVIMETIKTLAGMQLPKNLVVTDVGSTKSHITNAARKLLPSHVRFIGGHPMAGSEKHGPAAADPLLFQNALYVLTPLSAKPRVIDTAFSDFLKRYLGCRTIFLKPAIHDTIAATVSHLPHLLAVALVNCAGDAEERLPGTLQLAAGGFRDMTRIAAAPYKMWHDIFKTNREVIAPLLDECVEQLRHIKSELEKDTLEQRCTRASKVRGTIPMQHKGFLTPLSEILVISKDEVGVIATIAQTLVDKKINIKDMEVIKIREGEGGTIRLAFDSPETAKKAVAALIKAGFSAWERK